MTVMLLCGAGLLVRTMIALNGASTGADTQDVLTMEVALPGARYTPERRVQFYREALDALRALPGVQSAAAGDSLPSSDRRGAARSSIASARRYAAEREAGRGHSRRDARILPDARIPILRGREFTDADDATPTPGFIVNDAFVRTLPAGIDPLGVSLSVWMQQENPYAPIIGVVGDVSEGSVRDDPQPTIFYSHRQLNETAMTLLVRANQSAAMASAGGRGNPPLDPNLAVTRIRTFEGALAESLARERLIALISGGFALIGLLLASLGLYGLLAFLVTERTKEIGIRMALGAQRRTPHPIGRRRRAAPRRRSAPRSASPASLLLLRSFGTLLFGVTPNDAATYAPSWRCCRRRGAGVLPAGPPRRARRAADGAPPGVVSHLTPLLVSGDEVLLEEVRIDFKAQPRSRRDFEMAFANLRRI